MDNFKAVYKILTTFEKAMDYPDIDTTPIEAKALDVSDER